MPQRKYCCRERCC